MTVAGIAVSNASAPDKILNRGMGSDDRQGPEQGGPGLARLLMQETRKSLVPGIICNWHLEILDKSNLTAGDAGLDLGTLRPPPTFPLELWKKSVRWSRLPLGRFPTFNLKVGFDF
jgi:hypothetical protein